MATNRRKRSRARQASDGLPEIAYEYFGPGPFFAAETYEAETSPEERADIWRTHRSAIIERWRLENPANLALETWGEVLERLEKASVRRAHPAIPFKPELVR